MPKVKKLPAQLPRSRKSLPLWLTPEQTAELLGIGINAVREWCRQGKLPCIKIERTIRIDRDGLFLIAREQNSKGVS